MRDSMTAFRIVIALLLPVLACSSVPGLAGATPTIWVSQPWISVPGPTEAAATSAGPIPNATFPVPIPTGVNPLEVGILKCQNNPSAGIVPAQTPIVLVWGWSTDNETKRDEFISVSSFVLAVDDQPQDMSSAQRILESTSTVRWKLAIGRLPPGTHQIKLSTILARGFTESGGTFPAGHQPDEICQLVVQP
jgi:hypothetical protein